VVYFDLLLASLGEATRLAVEELMDQGRYEFQSDYARRYIGIGREEGRDEGRDEARRTLALRLLAEGMPVARVAALTDLTEDEVLRLQH
jgi:predicted transposase/invertase (TIGR01784 family)